MFESTINSADGNYSYVLIGDRERIWHKDNKSFYKDENGDIKQIDNDPIQFLKRYYSKIDKDIYKDISIELGIGLIDGFMGNIGYDMSMEFEPSLKPYMQNLTDNLNIADCDLIRPKIVVGYSHKRATLTIVTSMKSMSKYIDIIEDALKQDISYTPIKKGELLDEGRFEFSKEQFFDMVKTSKEYIKSGDVFQILMANRFTQKAKIDHFSFYRVLRGKNPSPYLFFLEFEDFSIAGSSPEVMVRLTDNKILLRPIAGTRKRGKTLKRDIELEEEMTHDQKEVAEHIMLVDLGRNDVGRVAKAGSVKVEELMRVERYSHVMHMVSDVVGELDSKYDMFDLFKATFTAGTMTGSPKIRAMELIAEYEGIKRGYYAGSIGYFGFDGNMDSAITIRTAMKKKDEIIFQAGAGVVADSKPELEFLEVKNKLGALVATLEELSDG